MSDQDSYTPDVKKAAGVIHSIPGNVLPYLYAALTSPQGPPLRPPVILFPKTSEKRYQYPFPNPTPNLTPEECEQLFQDLGRFLDFARLSNTLPETDD